MSADEVLYFFKLPVTREEEILAAVQLEGYRIPFLAVTNGSDLPVCQKPWHPGQGRAPGRPGRHDALRNLSDQEEPHHHAQPPGNARCNRPAPGEPGTSTG